MQFNKLSFKALILTLTGIISSMAAGIAPLTFGNASTDAENWNYLVNYRLWSRTAISFGDHCNFTNNAGWIGTATGDLTSKGNDAQIAGAVIVGGSIQNTGKMMLTTGPVRYGGSITDASRVSGTKCQGTTTAGNCANVPLYKDIPVPYISSGSWPSNLSNLTTPDNGTYRLDAQGEVTDFYFNKINVNNDSRLIILMPAGGRVTRIFTKSLTLGVHPEILVQYEGERLPRCSQSSSTCSGEYEGNLLIFVDEDIYFRNTDNSTIEGTIISTGTIAVESNMNFAGQLIAKEIMIGNQIKGDGFQFVPFNELPALTLSNKNATFLENDTWQAIKIGLDKESETDVTFKYCFKFNSQAVAGLYASKDDVADADASHDFPVCGEGSPATATILKGTIYPSKDIYIKPLIDGRVETSTTDGEKLWLVISDVTGAKISTENYDESQGGFNIFITDVDKLPSVSKELIVNVHEDEKHTFTASEFNFQHATQSFASVIISGLPTAGTLTYDGTAVSKDQVIDVADLGRLAYQPKANDFGDNYATFKYKVVGSGTSDNTSIEYTATVNVVPVNDKPTVADVTFTVSDRNHSVSGGPITVTDVSNEIGVDTYTYTLDATSADYSAFNSTFEIVPLSNGKKSTIAVKTGAIIDYSQKKEYVVQATVTDDASTETTKVAGSLTSDKFTITVKIEEEPETISPLTFGNANTDVDNWNYLVNYKMWGQDGVSFGNNNRILNEAGWIGSAKGNLTSTGNDAQIAGAIIVGGSVQNTGHMRLTTGPVRYGGSISSSPDDNVILCQGTTTAGNCADVPQYKNIPVPYISSGSWPSNLSNLTTPDNGTYRLDAQGKVADFYFNKINVNNDSRLIILMPAGGRVTRIFTKSLTLGVHPEILVQYEGERLPRCSQSSSTCSGEYEGNLLIFVDEDIYFRNTDNSTIEGTIISTGTIAVESNMSFAGQLIANNITIGNDVKGDGFQFVPFTDGSNTPDPELPTVTKELVINVNEDAGHTFTETEFNFSHATQTFTSVIISGLPTAGTLTYDGTAVSKDQVIDVADLGKLAYQPKANDFGDNYATFKYKVVGSGTSDNTSTEYTATINVAPVNDKPTVADVTFTVGDRSHSVSGGPITVTDVSNEIDVDTYTYTLDATSADYSAFNSTFEIVPSGNGKTATIKVKTGAVLDYSQKKEYVIQATVTDDASTETSKVAGPLTSDKFTITVKIDEEPETIAQESRILPLTFASGSGAEENDNWNYLINYKIWGQTGVSFGNNNKILNEAGWIGSAKGNLTSTGNDAQIAGVIIVGGSVQNTGKMMLTTGPVRYGGSITDASRVSGTKCQGTTTAGNCADVPLYREKLTVPKMTSWPSNLKDIYMPNNGTYTIDARSGSADLYFNSINFGQESRLLVLMPAGGRVTRIFAKKLNISENTTHPQIVVQYEGEQYPRCNTKSSNYTCSGEYEGNLVIYVDGDIYFRNADYSLIDGTIISTGTIAVESNMSFAGQLIANNITIRNDVKGDGFQFVPFNAPPALTLSNKNATFPESDKWETIKIGLDKESETDVTFKYCFRFNGQDVSGFYAGTSDVAPADASHDFPVCGTSGAPLTATIPKGKLYPSKDINIKPLIDGLVETSTSGGEKLWLVISDVRGAIVSTDNYDESKGGFNLFITDVDKQPTVTKELVINVNEDAKHAFTENEFNFSHATQTFTSVIISGLPTAGTLTYDGTAVSKDQVIDVADLGKLAYQPKANEFGNNYATFKYKVVSSGSGDNTSIEYTATVNVISVNDKPTVADATFTVNELDHSVTGDPITVTDVSNENGVDTYTYTLDATSADYSAFKSVFEIVPSSKGKTATLKVKSGAVIDYGKKKEYVVYATVTDDASTEAPKIAGSLTSDKFTITVKIEEENTDPVIANQTFTIPEKNTDGTDWPSGKTIGNVAASDPDGNELSFTVVTTDVPFKFNNNTKELVVTDGSILDFETKTTWTFTVKVDDGQGGTATAQITVNIEDVQEPEIYVNDEGATVISGNTSAGTVIENITENNDEDTQAQLNEITSAITYTVSEGTTTNATEYFDIDEHGTITAKDELVFEALYTGEDNPGNEFTFVITASGTNSKDETISTNITKKIIVADVNEEPVIKTDEPIDVPETALSNGEVVGKIDAIDPDSCSFNPNYACREGSHPQGFNKLTYTIDEILEVDGSTDFPFEIDPNTGVITFRQGPSLIRQYRYSYNTAIVRRVNELNNTRQRRYEFIVKVTDSSTDPKNPPKSVKKKIVLNITETAHILSSSSGNTTSSSSEVSSSSAIVSSSSSTETITSSGSNKPESSSVTVASSGSNKPESSSATVVSSGSVKPASSSATVASSSSNKPASSSATVASSGSNKPESSSVTVASSGSNKPTSSSATVASSGSVKPESSSATVASSGSNKPESSSVTVASSGSNKPASSSATVASSGSNKPTSSSATVVSSGSNKPESSSATVASSGSNKPASSSAKASSSDSSKPKSSSGKKITSSSSTSRNDKSSSSNKDVKSSSSKTTSSSSRNSEYDAPTFYVRMTGAFEFEIVMEEALPNIAKRYAVMDMKGQVLSVGELNEKGAHIKVPTSGAYIVKVGLGYRRINVK